MIEYLTDEELVNLPTGDEFAFDVESYKNFASIQFAHIKTNKRLVFRSSPGESINTEKLGWVLWNFKLIGFNSKAYDMLLVALAIAGKQAPELKTVTNRIINGELKHFNFENEFKINLPEVNHIDLIEVCPLQGSLKLYGARLHCNKIQDLPIPPEKELTFNEALAIEEYCHNDLDVTTLIYRELKQQIELREQLSSEYDQDLRSKSDAQIAEAVICKEVFKLNGEYPKRPSIPVGTIFHYNIPEFIGFSTLNLLKVLETVRTAQFEIGEDGSPMLPQSIKDLKITIGKSIYNLGMGGLHSCEKSISHFADDNTLLIDRDVESYYPRIIINQRLFPAHMGPAFLEVYETIVNRRVEAKRAKNTVVADSLKITINGSFGKLGSKWSALYAPDLMIQVTLTGQLSLLMLIERLEYVGISVVSANTDGIVIRCEKSRYDELNGIISEWEKHTNFTTEETQYSAVFSRDINNYIAVKLDGKCKTKGAYSNPWDDTKTAIFRFHKNPQHTICIDAVVNLLTKQIPVEETIKNCTDIKKFLIVRNVRGGGSWKGKYLGKVVRWYYAHNEGDCIRYTSTGNKVATSDGAMPIMELPNELPTDIDYKKYIGISVDILYDIGYLKKATTGKLF